MSKYFVKRAFAMALVASYLAGCYAAESDERIVWQLPNGISAIFYHDRSDPSFSDHPKVLEILDPKVGRKMFTFGASHSGYNSVSLYINSEHSIVWLVDNRNGQIGVAIKLDNYNSLKESAIPIFHKEGVELFGKPQIKNELLLEQK